MTEKYKSFEELATDTSEDSSYSIEVHDRGTDFVILGIHAGEIEPGTAEVVRAISGDDLSSYLFMGGDRDQHITSHNFDEKSCVELVTKSKKAISIHGKAGAEDFVMLGGLDAELISVAGQALRNHGFTVLEATDDVAGKQESNICNRGTTGKGLQVEMSRGLRDLLMNEPEKLEAFAQVIRHLIQR